MLVKFFKNKGRGSARASIGYLVSKPDGKYRVLIGSPELSCRLAESLEFKNKYTVGCLSFEEKNIDEELKYEIMERFEECLFAGLAKDSYNICWIEHTDKGRLELNFFIPNVELHSGKRLQPYYDKADRPLVENFKRVINHEYGLSDPNNPEKKQVSNSLSLDRVPKKAKELKLKIDEVIIDLIKKGQIKGQKDVLEVLKKAGFEISRVTDRNISIKSLDAKGRNIRLSGVIYENRRLGEELGRGQVRDIEEYRRGKEESYREAQERLGRAVEKRKRFNISKYQTNDSKYEIKINNDIGGDDRCRVVGTDGFNYLDIDRKGQSSGLERGSRGVIEEDEHSKSEAMEQDKNNREGRSNIHRSKEEEKRDIYIKRWKKCIENIKIKVKEYGERFRDIGAEIIIGIRDRKQGIIGAIRGRREREREVNGISEKIRRREPEITRAEQENTTYIGRIPEFRARVRTVGKSISKEISRDDGFGLDL